MMERKEQMNKSDQSPVTVADFGIQALISMGMVQLRQNFDLSGKCSDDFERFEKIESCALFAYIYVI